MKNPEFSNGRVIRVRRSWRRWPTARRASWSPRCRWRRSSDRDRFNEGVLAEWYLPAYDDSAWGTKNTFLTWDAQDKPEDDKGHDYDGYGWYRVTVDVPARRGGQAAQAASRRRDQRGLGLDQRRIRRAPRRGSSGGRAATPWRWTWTRPARSRPGANVIAIRVWNDAEIGGLSAAGSSGRPSSRCPSAPRVYEILQNAGVWAIFDGALEQCAPTTPDGGLTGSHLKLCALASSQPARGQCRAWGKCRRKRDTGFGLMVFPTWHRLQMRIAEGSHWSKPVAPPLHSTSERRSVE